MIIKLADLFVDWKMRDTDFVSSFSAGIEEKPVMEIKGPEIFSESHGIRFVQEGFSNALHRQYGETEMLCADDTWEKNILYCNYYKDTRFTLPLGAICSRFAMFETLLLHGSLVDWCGNGIVFTGFSGVGKTTQAELWKKHLNGEIINGDKVFIRKIDSEVFAYGLPWHGSSGYCLDKKVPLKAIIALRQSPENRITRLNDIQCMEYFMPHIFLPSWDENSLSFALKTLNYIIEKVPVWLLECRPDEDAVLLTKNTVL